MTVERALPDAVGKEWRLPEALTDYVAAIHAIFACRDPLPASSVIFLKKLIVCFPELHGVADRLMTRSGRTGSIDDLVAATVIDAEEDDGIPRTMIGLADTVGIEKVSDLLTGAAGGIPDADRYYYAMSAGMLRKRIGMQPGHGSGMPEGLPWISVDAVERLRRMVQDLTARTPQESADAVSYPTLHALMLKKIGVEMIADLSSKYADRDPESARITGVAHPHGEHFVYGPYMDLPRGDYRLAIELECGGSCSMRLDIASTNASTTRVVSSRVIGLDEGRADLGIDFRWDQSLGDGLFEGRLRVEKPAYVAVSLLTYKLSVRPDGTSE